MRTTTRNAVAGALVAATLAAGAWYAARPAADTAPATAATTADYTVQAAPRPYAAAPTQPAPAGNGQWLSGTIAAVEPLAAQLQRLGASGNPADAYRAYRLVRACKAVRARAQPVQPVEGAVTDDVLARVPDAAAFCGGMTDRMRMDSVALLERAARAGVDGAMEALVEEGPFGDPNALVTRPTDPLVQAWKERVNRMLGEQAGRGDWSSLYLLFTGFMFSNPAIDADRQSALAYGIALRDIIVKVDGVTEDEAIPFNAPFLDQVKAGLSREQQDRAVVQAAAIVDTALRQRMLAQRQTGRPPI